MQKLKQTFFVLFSFAGFTCIAQQDPEILEYINTYKEIAINEMQRTGVPAAIKLAQGIHETDAGTSVLVKKSNNHFGIKCKSDWAGMSVSHTDDAPNECFRKYPAATDSYKDHSDFLRKSSRYAFLFNLEPTDYQGWANGLKKAGYATNPKYPQVLIRLIEEYHLQDYTLIAMGKEKPAENMLVKQEVKTDKPAEEKTTINIPDLKPVVMPPEPEIVITAKKTDKKETKETAPVVQQPAKQEIKQVYPEGEFKINETRVIYVQKGTSYLSIAEKYTIALARVFEFNDMKQQEFAEKDQLIYLMRKRKTGNNELHTVKEGESLHDIAQTEAMRIESLLEYNMLRPGMKPATGAVLYLRTKAPAMPALAGGQ